MIYIDRNGLEAGYIYLPNGDMVPPRIFNPNIDSAMQWLNKCHPELANCGTYPKVVTGLLGYNGLQIGPVTLIAWSGSDSVDDAVASIAHEKMHCLNDPIAIEPYHTDVIEMSAQQIRMEYLADPSGANCKCPGNHPGTDDNNHKWPAPIIGRH
jgi:hypothetical protein